MDNVKPFKTKEQISKERQELWLSIEDKKSTLVSAKNTLRDEPEENTDGVISDMIKRLEAEIPPMEEQLRKMNEDLK